MRIERRLVFHALCVIEDTLVRSRTGNVPSSPALRLALGYLHAVADRRSAYFGETSYTTFWLEATQGCRGESGTADEFGRQQTLNSCANGMAHAVGMPRDLDFDAARTRLKPDLR
jgi:hypothetical protein